MAVTMNLKGTSNPSFKVGNASDGEAQLGCVDFKTTAVVPDAVGRMKWNSGDGTLDIGLAGGQSTLQVGQELLVRIYNGTGATLTDGQVVYITGSQGQRPTVALADADLESASSATIGLVTETITNGSEGFVTLSGMIRNLNTSAWSQGTLLYLSSTAGSLTNAKPQAPKHAVRIGWVVRQHASTGSILVQVQNGYELSELHDVLITSTPQQNEYIGYDSATGTWRNSGLAGSLKLTSTDSISANQTIDMVGAYIVPDMGTAGFDPAAKGWVIKNVPPSGLDPLNEPFSGLVVRDETDLECSDSQLTNNKLSVGGKAVEDSGTGMTATATLEVDLSDSPVVDDGGIGGYFPTGAAKFDIKHVDNGSGLVFYKSYRFKGTVSDVLIRDGIILYSPNGTGYKITVANDGSLTTTLA